MKGKRYHCQYHTIKKHRNVRKQRYIGYIEYETVQKWNIHNRRWLPARAAGPRRRPVCVCVCVCVYTYSMPRR